MTVSRRLRFEVLRRDGYTCRYCGARAPDVILTVDHVVPVALGGDDDPRNLITACQPCNAGKSSIPADAALVEDVDATAMLFAGAIERVAEQRRADRAAMAAITERFDALWNVWRGYRSEYHAPNDPGTDIPRDQNWAHSIERFISLGLTFEDLEHYLDVAMRSRSRAGGTWRYFCGCCWRELTERHEQARQLIEDGDA